MTAAHSAGSRGRVLLSVGDPNGIGPEIAVKACAAADGETPVVVAERFIIEPLAAAAGLRSRDYVPGAPAADSVVDIVTGGHLPRSAYQPGTLSAEAGAATIGYLTDAIGLARSGGFRAVVAGPHNETAVHAAGIEFRGYPPLVAKLTGVPEDEVFLLLVGGGLRIAHVTLHESMSRVLARLTPGLVTAAGVALHEALVALGIEQPRIAVFGINPHASEGGLFGKEDAAITERSVVALRDRGIRADGPAGADVLISTQGYDGYLAMYHDQGHIPVKLLAGRSACALAIGTAVPFCSVGHGTAFDIAGTGKADPEALIRALGLFRGSQARESDARVSPAREPRKGAAR
ncbi:MAG TPA: 4-hydroxythreonine-4-phosphate dehydrogenase PdxA [Trebonia sp.]|jgi:4-hydroxythreonine-4-phosphate dehydrogenase